MHQSALKPDGRLIVFIRPYDVVHESGAHRHDAGLRAAARAYILNRTPA
jgi:hypothetical protein